MPVPCPKAETETLQRVTAVPRTSVYVRRVR